MEAYGSCATLARNLKGIRYGTTTPAAGWKMIGAEHFTQLGLQDIVLHRPNDGSIWVGKTSTSAFFLTKFATLVPATGWGFAPGLFTGDSFSQIAAYDPSNGRMLVGRSTGLEFDFLTPGSLPAGQAWRFSPGDFLCDAFPRGRNFWPTVRRTGASRL